MIERETIIVGGGPAGAAAAWQLGRQGRDALVLDREAFPRDKLCAGWITPEVLNDLEFTEDDYPHRFLTFEHLKVALGPVSFKLSSPQHSIRRFEFDAWLLERSGTEIVRHNVHQIEKKGDAYIIDGQYSCAYLIGAGGTRCPVFRNLFRGQSPRHKTLQVVALELEFPYNWQDPDCYLWFLANRLPGYAWYVPKARGYLNIGVGGSVHRLKNSGDEIQRHWQLLVARLQKQGLIDQQPDPPHGYSYYLRGSNPVTRIDNAFIAGDAVGLATRDLCEGIGPAVSSGIAAAAAITSAADYSISKIPPFTSRFTLINRALESVYLRKTNEAKIRLTTKRAA